MLRHGLGSDIDDNDNDDDNDENDDDDDNEDDDDPLFSITHHSSS